MQSNENQVLTEDEISQLFDKCQATCIKIDENSVSDDEILLKMIQDFQIIQKSIIQHSIFSPNESFEDIHSEYLKFFDQLNYFFKVPDTTLLYGVLLWANLGFINSQIKSAVQRKLIDHYELLPKQYKRQYKALKDQKDAYKPSREDKISNFKENKELSIKLKNLEKLDNEKAKREIIGLNVIRYTVSILDTVPTIYQELQILEYKEKLDKDSKIQQQHKIESQKPVPKMKVWNIPAPLQPQNPYLIGEPKGQLQEHTPMCHSCIDQSQAVMRQETIAKVWQPGAHQIPTMTLDEFAEGEMKLMKKQEEMQKKAMEEAKKQEELQDDEKDEWSDQQTLKDRAWDDWKDANEKGAGNKKGR